jgi:hypothetical protein
MALVMPVMTWKVEEVGMIQHCFLSLGSPGAGEVSQKMPAASSEGEASPQILSSQSHSQVPLRQPAEQ